MLSEGEQVPDFTAPVANGEPDTFRLSEHIRTETPLVLAFFPGAFTPTCRNEMETFQERRDEITAAGGTVYGISIDTPFALNEFRDKLDLDFGLISDTNRTLIDLFGVDMDFAELGVEDVAQRAVFVLDDDRRIRFAWVSEDPRQEPNYEDVIEAVRELPLSHG